MIRVVCLLLSITSLAFTSAIRAQQTELSSETNTASDVNNTVLNAAADKVSSSGTFIKKLLQFFVRNGSSQLFDGTFVYLFDDQVQTIKVIRDINDDGQVIEKFITLDGSQQDDIRVLENQYCQLDNGWQYQFQAMSSSFPFRVNDSFQQLQKYYNFSLLETGSVAGNQAVRVVIQARDPDRYGYQLWFEPQTAALLKYKLMNREGKVIEQYLFTDFNLRNQKKDNTSSLPVTSKACLQQFSGLTDAFEQYFNKQEIPDGYKPVSYRKDIVKDSGRLAQQFQLSDGLASVSVFIEEIDASNKSIDGVARLGPLSVAGKTSGQHQITVLGAIPIDSALQILAAVNP